jgi:hypothetical protein
MALAFNSSLLQFAIVVYLAQAKSASPKREGFCEMKGERLLSQKGGRKGIDSLQQPEFSCAKDRLSAAVDR